MKSGLDRLLVIQNQQETIQRSVMKRIAIIGSGNVGANSAFFIAEKGTASVVLVDINEGLATGKTLDLSEAGPIRQYDTGIFGSASIDSIRGCDIVVLAAGHVRKPDQTRDDLYSDNAAVVIAICEQIKIAAPDAIVINMVEPVDMITLLAWRILGFERFRVLGVGGLLSSTRLRYLISHALGVSPREVTGMVVGPHRPNMVVLRDTVRISGIPAAELLTKEQFDSIIEEVRVAGDTILHLAQRSTSYYAPSAAVAALTEAIVRDTKEILPVSISLDGEYGCRDIAASVPARIGVGGVERVIPVDMSETEAKEFEEAIADLRLALYQVSAE
jgi:malate dehydrogenase